MLNKVESVDSIEVIGNGSVQVRIRTDITDGDVLISSAYVRHCIAPGEDFGGEFPQVQAICAIAHTPEVIQAYAVEMDNTRAEIEGEMIARLNPLLNDSQTQ